MLRWLIGIPVALVAGLGTVVVPANQWSYGWDRETSLMGIVYLWVFVGAVALLRRHEAGRRILLGATYAFGTVLAFLLVLTLVGKGPGLPPRYLSGLGLLVCVSIWAGLQHPSVKTAMRRT